MANAHVDDPGFWPGFVAAIAGLVQGLLIVAMALGVSLFVLGQLASGLPSPRAKTDPAAASSPAKSASLKTDKSAGFDQQSQGNTSRAMEPPALRKADGPTSPQLPPVTQVPTETVAPSVAPVVSVEFMGQLVQLPRGALRELEAAARDARAAGVSRFRVEVQTDAQDPARRRTAYLRLMAVRGVLMSAGFSASDIESRMMAWPDAETGAQAPQGDTVKVLALPPGGGAS